MVNCFGGANTKSVAPKNAPWNTQDDAEEWCVDEDALIDSYDAVSAEQGRKQHRRLSRKEKVQLQLMKKSKAEQDEVLAKYLGKSASSSSIPRALSSNSLRRCCQTPERRTKALVMMFDDDGKVVLKGAGRSPSSSFINESESSRTPSHNSLFHQLLDTPDRSDGCHRTDVESDGLSTCTNSPPVDFQESIDFIEPALSSVFNPKSIESIKESCFKQRAMNFNGHIVGRSLVREHTSIRRNLSWGHFSEISFNIGQSSSELCVPNRRHTVLVLTNEGDLDEETGKEDAACDQNEEPKESATHRKLSSVYESHHVHLSKLQEQMGDFSNPPGNLLELMARKMFSSHASLSHIDLDETEEEQSETISSMTKSHDLSECSDKLPKIKTKV